jgi:hypothetical protein
MGCRVPACVRRAAVVGLVVCAAAAPGCKNVIGADGYEVSRCGEDLAPDWSVVQSCVLVSGCLPGTPPWTLSQCITDDLLVTYPGLSKMSTATTCEDVAASAGTGYLTSTECSGKSKGWWCNGTRATFCDPAEHGGGYYRDCAKIGGTCAEYDKKGSHYAGCHVRSGCSDAADAIACTDNKVYECIASEGYGKDCSKVNAACGAGDSDCFLVSAQGCSGAVAACTGGVAQECANGILRQFRCSTSGLRCETGHTAGGETTGVCLAPGCTPADMNTCRESCEPGTTFANLCVGGAALRVNCASYGFNACKTVTGESGGEYVVCGYQ